MTEKLGYPKEFVVVEKALSQLPHIATLPVELPDRRVDILVYCKSSKEGLLPLLLIECKAIALSPSALLQVGGYNHYIQAPFTAIANQEGIFTGWYDREKQEYLSVDFLPCYEELINSLPQEDEFPHQ